MSLFPRFAVHDFPRVINSDFAPVWRLLDDYANQVVSARNSDASAAPRHASFSPRFDVQEVESAYELRGELPGVDQDHIAVEFPDRQTIVIKGQTEYTREEGSPATEGVKTNQQPTVEDEPEYADVSAEIATDSSAEATPVQTPTTSEAAIERQATQSAQDPVRTSRYWVSERSTGTFQRTFSFPAPVDTDNAKAKLRNGVLEVTIPKIQKAAVKRISIE